MESTGQYWRPVWNGLAGRKTDRRDACLLATRLEREDLKGSFVPPSSVRELRDMTRMRVHLLQDLNRVKNRIGDICETGNIKVSSVASDLFGVSGPRMLDAVVEGKRDPGWIADYSRGTLRGKRDQLELALEGTFTDHQREMPGRQLRRLKRDEAEIPICRGRSRDEPRNCRIRSSGFAPFPGSIASRHGPSSARRAGT